MLNSKQDSNEEIDLQFVASLFAYILVYPFIRRSMYIPCKDIKSCFFYMYVHEGSNVNKGGSVLISPIENFEFLGLYMPQCIAFFNNIHYVISLKGNFNKRVQPPPPPTEHPSIIPLEALLFIKIIPNFYLRVFIFRVL